MTLSAERKAVLGEQILRKRRNMKQRLSSLQEEITRLETSLAQNKGLYEQSVGPMPAEEV